MSDTPRTDERTIYNERGEWVISGFARHLERELNAANERIKRLEEAGDAMAKSCEVVEINQFGIEINGAWRKAKEAKP